MLHSGPVQASKIYNTLKLYDKKANVNQPGVSPPPRPQSLVFASLAGASFLNVGSICISSISIITWTNVENRDHSVGYIVTYIWCFWEVLGGRDFSGLGWMSVNSVAANCSFSILDFFSNHVSCPLLIDSMLVMESIRREQFDIFCHQCNWPVSQ